MVPDNLSAGEIFTFSFYYNATAGDLARCSIGEYESTTLKASTTSNSVANGTGWERLSVTHTITDSNSDRLRITIRADGNNMYADNCLLVYGGDRMFHVLNSNDGTAGVSGSVPALGTYDFVGIVSDDSAYVHPWAYLQEGTSVLNEVSAIADAMGSRLFAIDASGVLVFKSAFVSPYNVSYALIANIQSIDNGMQQSQTNKMKVLGAFITKETGMSCVWQMSASGIDNEASGSAYQYTMDAGDYWPDFADSESGFECNYSDIANEGPRGGQLSG
jgi:hypothetical protein